MLLISGEAVQNTPSFLCSRLIKQNIEIKLFTGYKVNWIDQYIIKNDKTDLG